MDYDYDDDYICDMDSDREGAIDSSEDDLDIVLHGTPEQRRKLDKKLSITTSRQKKSGDMNSSDDDFEKEMAAELNATMTAIETKHKSGLSLASTSQPASQPDEAPQFYDNSYFDSDSDEEGSKEEKLKRKHPIPTNDDLLYDPDADAADQIWVNKQRQRYQITTPTTMTNSNTSKQQTKLPKSDAVLNCPACMVQLCLDCQGHEKYQNQYRAMFVMNCRVDFTQKLKFPKHIQQNKMKNKKRKHNEETEVSEDAQAEKSTGETEAGEESYHPVKCEQCTTEVAVYDKDEVFHFFNVLASHA